MVEYFLGYQPEIETLASDYNENAPKPVESPDLIFQSRLDNYIIKFLESEDILDPVLSGYFCEILTSLVQKRGPVLKHYFMNDRPQFYDLMIDALSSSSIANLLTKFLTVEHEDFNALMDENIAHPTILSTYKKILQAYSSSKDPNYKYGAKTVLLSLAKECSTMSGSNQIADLIFKECKEFWTSLQEDLCREVVF